MKASWFSDHDSMRGDRRRQCSGVLLSCSFLSCGLDPLTKKEKEKLKEKERKDFDSFFSILIIIFLLLFILLLW